MALTILQRNNPAQALGTALGTGLGAGISGLLQNKIAEIERSKGLQRTREGLQALGVPAGLENLPENLQGLVVKDVLQRPQRQANLSALQNLFGGAPEQETGSSMQGPSNILGNQAGLSSQDFNNLARLGLQQQKAQQQQKQFETKEQRIQQHYIDTETKPYYDEITKSYKAAKNTNPVLQRMQTLLNKGNLPNPVFYGLANRVGRPLGLNVLALQDADAQEFEKLTNEFLKNAKDIFGSRLTNFDVETFLKGIPTLSQSDEGKQRIINNLRNVNEGALIKERALRQVIAANGGKRPANLDQLVEEIAAPELDQLAENFAEGTSIDQRTKQESVLSNNLTTQLAQVPQNVQASVDPISLSSLGEAGRHLLRSGSRVAESILGFPGDIASTALGGANVITRALTGGEIPGARGAQEFIPGSTNIRRGAEYLSGGLTEPTTKGEERADELISDFATFVNPITGEAKVGSALIKTALGNSASFLAEKVGLGPVGQGAAKIGTVLLSSFSGGRKALENLRDKAGKVIDSLPETRKIQVPLLTKEIQTIKNDVGRGFTTEGKKFVQENISGLEKLIENGKASVKELWNEKVGLNELYRDPSTPESAKKYIGRLVGSLNKQIEKYGSTNKSFGKAVQEVNDITKGLNQASDINQSIQKSVKNEKIVNPLINSLLKGAAFKSPGLLPAFAAGAGSVLGIQKFVRFTELLKNSAEAKKYYGNLVKAAFFKKPTLVQRYAHKLDKLATKEGY